jgi:hypothetical protein
MRAEETNRQSITADLYAYWNRIRGAHAAPTRADIDPGEISHVLADAFMIDLDPARDFPLRLCGARLDALWLKSLKGSAFLDFWRADARRAVAAALLTVTDAAAPFAGTAKAQAPGYCDIDIELLLLPVRKTASAPARIFGVLTPAYQPSWFGQVRAEPLELTSLQILAPQPFRLDLYREAGFRRLTPPTSPPRFVVHQGGKD